MVPLMPARAPLPAPPAASAAASGDKADGDAAEVKTIESGKLIMATNAQFPPYEMVADGDGVNGTGFDGIDIEIAAAIAEKLGLELQVDDMDFDAALTAVQQGQVRSCAGRSDLQRGARPADDLPTPMHRACRPSSSGRL